MVCWGWPGMGWSWSEPHLSITRAALRVLPSEDQRRLTEEIGPLGDQYCLIPDHVFTNPANARFAMVGSRPGERYLTILHLPGTPMEVEEVLRYFVGKAAEALREGRQADGARFLGTICHLIEDYGSPSHVVPGDNMFTLMQQFLPPPPGMRHRLLHGPIESGALEIGIGGYRPKLLGSSVAEVAWRLRQRINEAIVHARRSTIPIIQGLYAEDRRRVIEYQSRAAEFDACVVADAIHSVIALGSDRFEASEKVGLEEVSIGSFYPLEAPQLHYPQKLFSGGPAWGPPTHGYLVREEEQSEPLRLRMEGNDREQVFGDGIAACGRTLSYALPEEVFSRFRVVAGFQAGVGERGAAEFVIKGDGKVLVSVALEGTQAARTLECSVVGIKELQLAIVGKGSHPKSNYAIWAAPLLVKGAAGQGASEVPPK
jgi:hypothetical protein